MMTAADFIAQWSQGLLTPDGWVIANIGTPMIIALFVRLVSRVLLPAQYRG